jgi:hypothetical protein
LKFKLLRRIYFDVWLQIGFREMPEVTFRYAPLKTTAELSNLRSILANWPTLVKKDN